MLEVLLRQKVCPTERVSCTRELLQPFPNGKTNDRLRISFVRHPCDWLCDVFSREVLLDNDIDLLPRTSLDDFVKAYLDRFPGLISKIFLSYKAGSFLRAEDLPGCAYELLEMLGIPRPETVPQLTHLRLAPKLSSKNLRRELRKAEEEIFDAFDYY